MEPSAYPPRLTLSRLMPEHVVGQVEGVVEDAGVHGVLVEAVPDGAGPAPVDPVRGRPGRGGHGVAQGVRRHRACGGRRQGGKERGVPGGQAHREVVGRHPGRQPDHLQRPRGHRRQRRRGGGVALQQPVVVAVGRVPRARQPGGVERGDGGLEQPGQVGEAELALVAVGRPAGQRADLVGVPVVVVERGRLGVLDALVPVRRAAVGLQRPAVEQGEEPLELVGLLVVGVVPGGDRHVEGAAGHRPHAEVGESSHHGVADVGGQRLLGAPCAAERDRLRRLVCVPVEELDPGGGLGVHDVDVGEVDDGGQRRAPALAPALRVGQVGAQLDGPAGQLGQPAIAAAAVEAHGAGQRRAVRRDRGGQRPCAGGRLAGARPAARQRDGRRGRGSPQERTTGHRRHGPLLRGREPYSR